MSSIPEMCTVTSPKKHGGCRDVNDIDDYKNHTENYTIDLLQWLTSVDVMAALDAFSFLGRMSHCHLVLLSTKWLVVRVHPALHKQARTWHVNGHPKAAQNGPRGSKVWNDWPMLTTNHHSPHRLELHTMVGSASLLGVRDSRAAWSLRDQPTIQCLFQIASTRVPLYLWRTNTALKARVAFSWMLCRRSNTQLGPNHHENYKQWIHLLLNN